MKIREKIDRDMKQFCKWVTVEKKSLKWLGKHYGCSREYIRQICEELKINRHKGYRSKELVETYIHIPDEFLKKHYKKDMTIPEIAEHFGVSKTLIHNRAKDLGLVHKDEAFWVKNLHEIQKMMRNGASQAKICEKFGVSNSSLYFAMKKYPELFSMRRRRPRRGDSR